MEDKFARYFSQFKKYFMLCLLKKMLKDEYIHFLKQTQHIYFFAFISSVTLNPIICSHMLYLYMLLSFKMIGTIQYLSFYKIITKHKTAI